MNTPKPCDHCVHLYINCMLKDDPDASAECKLGLPLGRLNCLKFEQDPTTTHSNQVEENRGPYISANRAIQVLNEALNIDHNAIEQIIEHRVTCNNKLADKTSIQVITSPHDNANLVGALGLINGLFGLREDGYGFIVAIYAAVCPEHGVQDGKFYTECTHVGCKKILDRRLLKFVEASTLNRDGRRYE